MNDKLENEDNNVKTSFSAVVMFLDDGKEETFDVEIDTPIENLTYDAVEEAIWNAVDEKYGYDVEDFEDDNAPYEVIDIVVNEDGESYPVVPEDKIDKLDVELDAKKYLVLPWAKYSLTPECKLWMTMKENGIVDEDEPFDYEKYHSLVEVVNENK